MSLYDTLGVAKDADAAEIKRAHRKAARKHHPDIGGDREEFEDVQHAYLVLSDRARREKYDRTGTHEDDAPDNRLSALTEAIMSAFDTAVAQSGPFIEQRDLIATTRKIMEHRKVEITDARANLETERAKLGKLMKRLKFDGDGFDPIGAALSQRIEQIASVIEQGGKEIADYAAAIAYLDHYGFAFDQPAAPTRSGSTMYVRLNL